VQAPAQALSQKKTKGDGYDATFEAGEHREVLEEAAERVKAHNIA
jgi:hypothetical protein